MIEIEEADKHELAIKAGFKPKAVRWAIVFDSKAGFTGLVPLGLANTKKNPGRTFKKCPDLSHPELVSGSKTKSQNVGWLLWSSVAN